MGCVGFMLNCAPSWSASRLSSCVPSVGAFTTAPLVYLLGPARLSRASQRYRRCPELLLVSREQNREAVSDNIACPISVEALGA